MPESATAATAATKAVRAVDLSGEYWTIPPGSRLHAELSALKQQGVALPPSITMQSLRYPAQGLQSDSAERRESFPARVAGLARLLNAGMQVPRAQVLQIWREGQFYRLQELLQPEEELPEGESSGEDPGIGR